jgi:hypothetical protein
MQFDVLDTIMQCPLLMLLRYSCQCCCVAAAAAAAGAAEPQHHPRMAGSHIMPRSWDLPLATSSRCEFQSRLAYAAIISECWSGIGCVASRRHAPYVLVLARFFRSHSVDARLLLCIEKHPLRVLSVQY